jgi:hyaluronan synthase
VRGLDRRVHRNPEAAAVNADADTIPNEDWRQIREHPYTGPNTGEVLDATAVLEELAAAQRAVTATRVFPRYDGPYTGEQERLEPGDQFGVLGTAGRAAVGRAADDMTQNTHRHRGEKRVRVRKNRGTRRVGRGTGHRRVAVLGNRGGVDRDRGAGADHAAVLAPPQERVRSLVPDVSLAGGRWTVTAVTLSLAGGLYWGYRHVLAVDRMLHGHGYQFTLVFLCIFLFLAWQLVLAWASRPVVTDGRQQEIVDALTTTVNVPVYNEDPALLHNVLRSLFEQTRPPGKVSVVDDGSKVDYSDLRAWWERNHPRNVRFEWIAQPNGGKRTAQMATFDRGDSDILITIDSDTMLHPRAIEEGLKPFADPRVMSVAGLVLALNKHKNLLVKVIDLVITTWQLTSRSALSMTGNVLVNSGPYALYRSSVIAEARDAYLAETFCGRPVHFSDDALLTMFALLRGRAVQQHTAVAFTTWPEGLSHHVRQQLRWCRGMFIRSFWRFRYLPVTGVAFWFEIISWIQFFLSTAAFLEIFIIESAVQRHLVLPALIITPLLTYGVTLRTLMIRRDDETRLQQLGVYALSPLVILWGWLIFRPLRVWGMLTCLKLGWGTRQDVEVTG